MKCKEEIYVALSIGYAKMLPDSTYGGQNNFGSFSDIHNRQ